MQVLFVGRRYLKIMKIIKNPSHLMYGGYNVGKFSPLLNWERIDVFS